MRAELGDAVKQVLTGLPTGNPPTVDGDDLEALLAVADIVTRARTAVERDQRGDPIDSHALEMPTRFAKQLAQIVRGSLLLGASRERALALAMRAAADTMPRMRFACLMDVTKHEGTYSTGTEERGSRSHA